MKKLIALILGIGALIAIALGIFVSSKTKEMKGQMEQTLNKQMENITSKVAAITSWEPFVCEGILQVGCYSKQIVVNIDDYANFILRGVGFDINSLDEHSLQALLNVKEMKLETQEPEAQEDKQAYEQIMNVVQSFIPQNAACDVALNQSDDKLIEQVHCNIKASNADYEVQNEETYQRSQFSTQNIAQILEEFYAKIMLQDTFNAGDGAVDSVDDMGYKYAINKSMIKTRDRGFSNDLYKYFELTSALQGMPADRETYAQYAKQINTLFTIGASLMLNGDFYQDAFIKFGDALESYMLGDTHELGFLFSHKKDRELQFVSPEVFMEDPNISHFFENYELEVISN